MKGEMEPPLSHSNKSGTIASACLGGQLCRYDGTAKPVQDILQGAQDGKIQLACPECLGGLTAPRAPAEIQGGDGYDVLDGKACVKDAEGNDVTAQFLAGAERLLELVRLSGASRVVLKSKSPSCGVHAVYDGTFTGATRPGPGVAAALLQRAGIEVAEQQ